MTHLVRKTKNIEVRPIVKEDFPLWVRYYETMGKAQNIWDLTRNKPNSLKKIEFSKILRSRKKLRDTDQFYDLSVFERASGQLVGFVAAMNVTRSLSQTCFLGYSIHQSYWGKGYGKEATLNMIDIAFRDLKLHRVEAGIEPYNRRSIMLARSIGLRKEGLKKRAVYIRGQWQDLVMYSATCEEFGHKWKSIPKTRPH